MPVQLASHKAETQKQRRLENQRQGIFTLKPFSTRPIDHHFRQAGTDHETDHRTDTGQNQIEIADRQPVGHAGDDPRHVRRILLDGKRIRRHSWLRR